MEVVYWF